MSNSQEIVRCGWSTKYQTLIDYHDKEWGVPLFDETRVFEMFSLDCFQAGLSWNTILNKRKDFLSAFDNFNIDKIAEYDAKKNEGLLSNPGIVRNRLKVAAVINNARISQSVRNEFGSFSNYIWSFNPDRKTIHNNWEKLSDIPATSIISDSMSRDMVKRGFKFAGSTICYAFMQSIGMVNDHLVTCFRHAELKNKS